MLVEPVDVSFTFRERAVMPNFTQNAVVATWDRRGYKSIQNNE